SPTRTLQIRGIVLNQAGQPLGGASVGLSPRKSDGHSVVLPEAQTAADGRFTIHGVLPGNYVMFVTGQQTTSGARGPAPDIRVPMLTAALPLDVSSAGLPELRIQTVPAVD